MPAKVIVRRDIREKLKCNDCVGEIVRAPTGDKVVGGGRLGPRLVAQLIVDKYSDGLPLHRQKERFARMGLDLPVSTLADQVTRATDLLRPVWRSVHELAPAPPIGERECRTVASRRMSEASRRMSVLGGVGVPSSDLFAVRLRASTDSE